MCEKGEPMSVVIESQIKWLSADFWNLLDRYETQHRRAQSDYDSARRQLDRVDPKAISEFRDAWARYCEVILELDRTAGELEHLRVNSV